LRGSRGCNKNAVLVMVNQFARYLISAAAAVWLAATLAFAALRLLPGNAVESQLLDSGVSAEVLQQRRSQLGFDLPVGEQYLQFMTNLARGNLGYSLANGEPVTDIIIARLIPTLELTLSAVLVAALMGIGLGVAAGLNSAVARNLVSLSLSMPIYWTGTLVIYTASSFALNGATANSLMPIFVLGFHAAGAIARVLEGQVRETLHQDYVRTARAKGLHERAVIGGHVLRVALVPVVSVIALQAGFLFTGTVITESLFARPGIGRLLVERTLAQDYPVVQGIVILSAAVYTLVNGVADMTQHLLDPRLRVNNT